MISPHLAHVIVTFWETILPDAPDRDFSAARAIMAGRLRTYFQRDRFDDPTLAGAVPLIFRVLQWAPLLFVWLIWKPLPFTWLKPTDRRRLLEAMESSRIYAVRGLFAVAKVYAGMFFFDDVSTHAYIGYDGVGVKPATVRRTPALDEVTLA